MGTGQCGVGCSTTAMVGEILAALVNTGLPKIPV